MVAFNDYARLGISRSLLKLHRHYTISAPESVPTKHLRTLKEWSRRYGWQKRVEEYDAELERFKTERAEEIMRTGLALTHNRVDKLKAIATLLEGQLYEQGEEGDYHNIWLPDVKQIGSGPTAERVDIERFNAPIISEYRAALDDLAKETGGRVRKSEITGKDGGPIKFKAEDLSDDELACIAASGSAGATEATPSS